MMRACACAALLAASLAAARAQGSPQTAPAGADEGKFALEIVFLEGQPPSYWQVPGGGWSGRFGRLPDWQPRAGALRAQAVNVASRPEGDGVRINVSVHVGERDHFDRQLDVATLLARAGETVVVGELRSFGVAPIRIKVLPLSPAAVAAPSVESAAPSVAVLGVERTREAFPSYAIRVRNLSGKDIAALDVFEYAGDEHPAMSQPHRERDEPLVRAGEVYEVSAFGGHKGLVTDQGYTPGGLTRVVIVAAVFADGTYEGDAKQAAQVRALWLGRRLQLARLAALLRQASAANDAETADARARLRAQVSTLDEGCDEATLGALLAQFPALGAKDGADLKKSVEFELHYRKNELLLMLEKIDGASKGVAAPPGFRDWLARTAGVYADWLARLPAN